MRPLGHRRNSFCSAWWVNGCGFTLSDSGVVLPCALFYANRECGFVHELVFYGVTS